MPVRDACKLVRPKTAAFKVLIHNKIDLESTGAVTAQKIQKRCDCLVLFTRSIQNLAWRCVHTHVDQNYYHQARC